jgi:hypothetical protein
MLYNAQQEDEESGTQKKYTKEAQTVYQNYTQNLREYTFVHRMCVFCRLCTCVFTILV